MTLDEKNTLIGLCIGDGCVREHRNGTSRTLYGEFTLKHSTKQLEYSNWKKRLLASILKCKEPETQIYIAKGRGNYPQGTPQKDVPVCAFSKGHPYFRIIRRALYPGGHKTFTRQILNRLNLLGLMMWYLDDGHLAVHFLNGKIRTYRLYITIGRPIDEVKTIIKYLKEVWDMDFSFGKHGDNCFRISVGKKNAQKFIDQIKPIIEKEIPSMLYKVSPNDNPRVRRILKLDESPT